jgi:hypothetical protein
MNNVTWQEANNRYLAASLHWLRLVLGAWVPRETPAPAAAAPVADKAPGFLDRLRGASRASEGTVAPAILPAPSADNPLEQAAAAREEAARMDPPPALVILAGSFGLSSFERDTLLVCAAAELDPSFGALCAAVPGNGGRGYPTFALALQVLADPAWDALSPQRPLRYSRLLEVNQPGITPLTAAGLRADERIVNYIKGLNVVDERLDALLTPCLEESRHLAPSQWLVVDDVAAHLRFNPGDERVPVVLLLGSDSGSKRDVASQVCAGLDRRLYRLSLDALPAPRADLETFARLWQRESLLLPVALYVDAEELESAGRDQATALQWLLSRPLGLVFVGLRERPDWGMESGYAVTVGKPSAQEQCDAWLEALGGGVDDGATAALLAGQFNLNLRDILAAAAQANRSPGTGPLSDKVWQASCNLTRPRLDLLAQHLEAKATWEDLVLPAEALGLLRQIATQVRGRYRVYQDWGYARKMSRGLGISALFAGESGTGKTMAAEVLANELRLALYRIDLSAIVSKYIGETEKNLRKLFDAAEQGGAILFFDEADALFGKRSEVKDSHDRYANIEINYLLQRMEAFSGIAILATNMKSAVDSAFMRRLRFIINFPFPGAAERKEMWQKALAPAVPRAGLDYERLARFSLSGGNIQSIALNAAFAAAQREGAEQSVTLPLLLSATRSELRKLDKQINEAEFRSIQTAPDTA